MITWKQNELCITCKEKVRYYGRYCYNCYCNTPNYKKYKNRITLQFCQACGKSYIVNGSGHAEVCMDCWKESHNYSKPGRGYIRQNNKFQHILIAEIIFKRPILQSESVHHLNCIQSDNRLYNLILMSNSEHVSLHQYLRIPWIISQKKQLSFNLEQETWKIIQEYNMVVKRLNEV